MSQPLNIIVYVKNDHLPEHGNINILDEIKSPVKEKRKMHKTLGREFFARLWIAIRAANPYEIVGRIVVWLIGGMAVGVFLYSWTMGIREVVVPFVSGSTATVLSFCANVIGFAVSLKIVNALIKKGQK